MTTIKSVRTEKYISLATYFDTLTKCGITSGDFDIPQPKKEDGLYRNGIPYVNDLILANYLYTFEQKPEEFHKFTLDQRILIHTISGGYQEDEVGKCENCGGDGFFNFGDPPTPCGDCDGLGVRNY